MDFFSLNKLFSKIPSFSKTGKYSLLFLNVTQFLGVINDNVFKFVMAYLLIDTLGYTHASTILSATGAIYVIPFLLFSSSAGIIADRFSKQKLLVLMKMAEILLMGLALFAFSSKSVWGCYTLLFFLSTHSAMFGPSKYGIIPELVSSENVSRANGFVTSFTYLAIIVGTFLASFLTEITHRQFILVAGFCLLVAIGGLFSATAVKKTAAQSPKKRFNLLFIREIFRTLRYTRTIPHLLPAIFGSAFFLLIGGFTQLNIIPFAIQSLHMNEVDGGYLFLATALGIALGSWLAGKASRKRAELGLSCLAGFGIAFFFVLLCLFSSHLSAVIACLVAIGVLGGAFIVPFDTFIQLNSDDEKRGQTIGAANFLSFFGVLLASLALYFFNDICGLTAATSFAVIGILTLLVTTVFFLRLSDLSLPFFSRTIFRHLAHFSLPDTEPVEKSAKTILVMEKATCKNALLLAGTVPNVHFLFPMGSKQWRWFFSMFYSFHKAEEESNIEELLETARTFTDRGKTPCLMLDGQLPEKIPTSPVNMFLEFFKNSTHQILVVRPFYDSGKKTMTLRFEK
jgi:acyl-[acyl-carrier-protein]-phospholipid O-acyltransferase/long-chain-fatty-acid--[acyl-carrier-protein] ligase